MTATPQRRTIIVTLFALLFVTAVATPLFAHDMFWRLTAYFVAPQTSVKLPVLNGTFSKSENAIEWARVADLSAVAPSGRIKLDSTLWSASGDTSVLSFQTGDAGTYVVGLSTKPKEFQLDAKAFNGYLSDDGIPDVLALRKRNGTLNTPARERYSKHIKAIFQVGATHSAGWNSVLGYPAELVPVSNPYDTKVGSTMKFRCLVDGKAVAKQLVMVGGRAGTTGDTRLAARSLRSDANGVVSVALPAAGRWYVKFIHMVPVTDGRVDYESKWATITFEVR